MTAPQRTLAEANALMTSSGLGAALSSAFASAAAASAAAKVLHFLLLWRLLLLHQLSANPF
jgi:hypothetical protein